MEILYFNLPKKKVTEFSKYFTMLKGENYENINDDVIIFNGSKNPISNKFKKIKLVVNVSDISIDQINKIIEFINKI